MKLQNANTNNAIAYALEPHHLAVAKLVSSREKDHEFVSGMLQHKIISPAVLSERVGVRPSQHAGRAPEVRAWVARTVTDLGRMPTVDRGPAAPEI